MLVGLRPRAFDLFPLGPASPIRGRGKSRVCTSRCSPLGDVRRCRGSVLYRMASDDRMVPLPPKGEGGADGRSDRALSGEGLDQGGDVILAGHRRRVCHLRLLSVSEGTVSALRGAMHEASRWHRRWVSPERLFSAFELCRCGPGPSCVCNMRVQGQVHAEATTRMR